MGYRRRRKDDKSHMKNKKCSIISCIGKFWARGLCKKHYEYYITSSYRKKYRDGIRIDILSHYSNGTPKCNCCGEKIIKFLTIDHMNNDGALHRRQIPKSSLYYWLRNNNYPSGFQVLCYNCNCARAKNNNICPHKEVK